MRVDDILFLFPDYCSLSTNMTAADCKKIVNGKAMFYIIMICSIYMCSL